MNTLETVREALRAALPHMQSPMSIEYVTAFLVTGNEPRPWEFDSEGTELDHCADGLVYWFCRLRRAPYGLEDFDTCRDQVTLGLRGIERNLPKTP